VVEVIVLVNVGRRKSSSSNTITDGDGGCNHRGHIIICNKTSMSSNGDGFENDGHFVSVINNM